MQSHPAPRVNRQGWGPGYNNHAIKKRAAMKVTAKAIWPTGLLQSDMNRNQAVLIHRSYHALSRGTSVRYD